jgi:outer membrane protein TolC
VTILPRKFSFVRTCAVVILVANACAAAPSPDPAPLVFTSREMGFDLPRIDPTRAVLETLELSPQIQLQAQEVEQRIGGVVVTAAPFDTTVVGNGTIRGEREDRNSTRRDTSVAAGQQQPPPLQNPFVRRDSLYEWELGVRKKFRNGIQIEPTTNYRFAGTDNADGFNNRSEYGFNFGVVIPLARGLGTTVNEAPEISARYDWKASVFSLRNVTAQAVLTTMTNYWRCRAAERRYRLLVENEEISTRLVGTADSMVEARELANSQLAQIQADRDSTTAQRIQGEQGLIQARQALALAIGYGPDRLPIAPLPADPLPEPPEHPRYPELNDLTATALALRDDLHASRMLEKSRKILVVAGYLNLRPIVNLRLNAGYVPFDTRNQLTTDRGGQFTGSVGLNLDWPLENSQQRGTLIQDIAIYSQSEIRTSDLARNIVSAVISDFAELRSSAAQVVLLRDASRLNRQALNAQEELFSLGESALTDVITARQRLISSELEYLAVSERYAISIVQLRYDVGLLLPWSDAGSWITPQLWSSIPFIAPATGK